MPVVENGRPIGMVTEREKLSRKSRSRSISRPQYARRSVCVQRYS
jgi:hypothetical protein